MYPVGVEATEKVYVWKVTLHVPVFGCKVTCRIVEVVMGSE
jgi:hypothetical protein